MSNTNTTAAKAATRNARLAEARKTADETAVVELGDGVNVEVTATSSLTTSKKVGTKTSKTGVTASVSLGVTEEEEDTAAQK